MMKRRSHKTDNKPPYTLYAVLSHDMVEDKKGRPALPFFTVAANHNHSPKTPGENRMTDDHECRPDPDVMLQLANMRMPFGRYKDRRLIDLPEAYVIWLANKGFPGGHLGDMLRMVYEIKVNGLEYLFKPLRRL